MKYSYLCFVIIIISTACFSDTIYWEDGTKWENVSVTRIAQDSEKTSKPYYLVIETGEQSKPFGVKGGVIDKRFIAIVCEEKQKIIDQYQLTITKLKAEYEKVCNDYKQAQRKWSAERELVEIKKRRLEDRTTERRGEQFQSGASLSPSPLQGKDGTQNYTTVIPEKDQSVRISRRETATKSSGSTVYVTDTGKKYHRGSCGYLRKSRISISKQEARKQDYTRCSRCKP